MFDDEWDDDEPDEGPDHDVIVRGALRLQGWRRRLRDRAIELLEVVRSDDLDIDWYGFGSTLGAFTGGLYDGFLTPAPAEYDIELLESRDAIMARGGLCAPFGHHVEIRWDPWARYYPPLRLPLLSEIFPTITAPRGAISFLAPPSVPIPWSE